MVLAELGPGSDADRVARELRDAGAEVVHTGRTTAAELVAAVLQEDPDAVAVDEGVAHVAELLAGSDAADVPVLALAEVVAWVADTGGERTHHRW